MNLFQQALSEAFARVLSQAPGNIARKLPGWMSNGVKAYVRWLWRLDVAMKLVMLVLNVVALQIAVARLPGPTDVYRQLAGAVSVLLVFFVIASILFGGSRR
jgi:hypothetical protein